jgi:hypothetical protein
MSEMVYPAVEVNFFAKLARVPAAPGPRYNWVSHVYIQRYIRDLPVFPNSAKRTSSVLGVAVDQMDHPAGLMCEPKTEFVNTTLC